MTRFHAWAYQLAARVREFMLPKLPRERSIEFLRKMFLIRHFEEALVGLYKEGWFRGEYHLYIGQEATGVPALSCLEEGDYLFSNHRNHGHLLARGADPGRLLAEILGRRDGYNKGKGGTFHTAVAALGIPHTSAIVAGMIPLAGGAAYSLKVQKNNHISVCLFGDGALEEGAAVEGFNLASLQKLPVLYLCENNDRGKLGRGRSGGPLSMAADPLTRIPKAYGIPSEQVVGKDCGAVHSVVSDAVNKIRAGEGPQFIESQILRFPGSDSNSPALPIASDSSLAWDVTPVPEAEREWYRNDDPILIFIRELVEAKQATKEEIVRIEEGVRETMDRAVQFALASPHPAGEVALEDVFD